MSLYDVVMAALTPARAALAGASSQYPEIVVAQKRCDVCRSAVDSARTRLSQAQQAVRLADTADKANSITETQQALAAAKLEFTQDAPAALALAEADLTAATQALVTAQAPVQDLIDVCTHLHAVVATSPGDLASHAHNAVAALERAIVACKARYPDIAPLELAHSRCHQTAQEASVALGQRQRSNTAAQQLVGVANTATNQKAAAATVQALTAAETVKSDADTAAASADAALTQALQPVQSQLELQRLVQAALNAARENDTSYRQNAAWERQQQEASDEREASRDPDCTCSMSENTCLHCIMKQQHSACGHDRESSMSD